MLFNALNLIFLNVTMLNCTKKIFTQISLAGLYYYERYSGIVTLLLHNPGTRTIGDEVYSHTIGDAHLVHEQ